MHLVQQYTSSSNVRPVPATLTTPNVIARNNEESLESKLQSDRLLMSQLQQSKLAIDETIRTLEKRMTLAQSSIQEKSPKEEISPEPKINTPVYAKTAAASVTYEDSYVEENSCNNAKSFVTNGNLAIEPLPQRKPKNIASSISEERPSNQDITVANQITPIPVNYTNIKSHSIALQPPAAMILKRQETEKSVTQPRPIQTPITTPVPVSTVKTLESDTISVQLQSKVQINAQAATTQDKIIIQKSTEAVKPLSLNSIVSLALNSALSSPKQKVFLPPKELAKTQPASTLSKTQTNTNKSTELVKYISQKKSSIQPAIIPTNSTATITAKSSSVPIQSGVVTTTQSASKKSKSKKNSPKPVGASKDTAKASLHPPAAITLNSSVSTISTPSLQMKPVPKKSSNVRTQSYSALSSPIPPKPTSSTSDQIDIENPNQDIIDWGEEVDIPIRKTYYPPIVVEILPNRLQHIQYLKNRFGKEFKVRTFGKTVKFMPEKGYENRIIKEYLRELEKTDNITWFVYPASST